MSPRRIHILTDHASREAGLSDIRANQCEKQFHHQEVSWETAASEGDDASRPPLPTTVPPGIADVIKSCLVPIQLPRTPEVPTVFFVAAAT